jgi:hypothetical protein
MNLFIFCFFYFLVLENDSKALHTLCKHSTHSATPSVFCFCVWVVPVKNGMATSGHKSLYSFIFALVCSICIMNGISRICVLYRSYFSTVSWDAVEESVSFLITIYSRIK